MLRLNKINESDRIMLIIASAVSFFLGFVVSLLTDYSLVGGLIFAFGWILYCLAQTGWFRYFALIWGSVWIVWIYLY